MTNQPYKLATSQSTLFFSLIAVSYIAYLILKTQFDFWPIYKLMTAVLFSLIFYITLLSCHKSMTIYLFYIPISLMVLMLTNLRTAIITTILILVLCFFTPLISEKLDVAHPEPLSKEYLRILRYLVYVIMLIVGYLSFLILYYYNELNKIKLKHQHRLLMDAVQEETAPHKKLSPTQKLYQEILVYMEAKKPFRNAEFTIKKMAKDLNTNQTYVSRALNAEGNKKFSSFLQEYRIKEVKEALLKDENNSTLEQIYKKAGFTHQATFNRIFKEMTGVTPSQYIDTIQNKKRQP